MSEANMLTGFSDDKIISLFDESPLWVKKACREILKRRDDFIPRLLDILDAAVAAPAPFISGEKTGQIHAALLLAQMRVTQAYPRLVSLLSHDNDDMDFLWGDMLTQCYMQMLRDTFNGEAFLLPRLIENRAISPWSRGMAIMGWGMHYFDGYISREEICGCFRRLIREIYTGQPDHNDRIVLSYIGYVSRTHQLDELIDDVKSVYARGGIDRDLCDTVEEYVNNFKDESYQPQDAHIDNVIEELEKARMLEDYREEDDPPEGFEDDFKTGRNEPCPCGSGKKYKHCCLSAQ